MESEGLCGRLVDSFTEKYLMNAYVMLVGLGRSK